MKGLNKFLFSLLLLAGFFSSCEKYTYTPLLQPPPAGYYDEINIGTVYNGNLIVAGNFTALFGSANYIAQWNGSSWQGLGSGLSSYYPPGVAAFTIYNNNLIVAGQFTNAGGQTVNNITSWNGTSWQSLGNGIPTGFSSPYASISALTVYNGNLIAGGTFEVAGSNCIAQWNGSSWTSIGGKGLGGYGDLSIRALAVYKGSLYAAGGFDSIGGQSLGGLYVNESGFAKWNGSIWQPIVINGYINELFNYDSNLVALGNFDSIAGIKASNGAIFNGTSWTPLNTLNTPYVESPVIYNNAIYYTNYVYSDSAVCSWNTSTTPIVIGTSTNTKERWNNPNIQTSMYPLCVYNGNLIAGGWFTSVNGVSCNYNLAKWNGTNWSSF